MADKKSIVIKVKYPSTGRQAEENTLSAPEMITEWNVRRIAFALGIVVLIMLLPLYFYWSGSQYEHPQESPAAVEQTISQEFNQGAVAEHEHDPETKAANSYSVNDTEPKQPEPVKQSEADQGIAGAGITQLEESTRKQKTEIEAKDKVKKLSASATNENTPRIRKSNRVIRAVLAYRIMNKEPVQEINSPVRVSKAKVVQVNYFTELKGMNKRTIYHEWIKKGKVVSRQRLKISADRWRTASSKLLNHTAEGRWLVRAVDEKGRLLDEKKFTVISDR